MYPPAIKPLLHGRRVEPLLLHGRRVELLLHGRRVKKNYYTYIYYQNFPISINTTTTFIHLLIQSFLPPPAPPLPPPPLLFPPSSNSIIGFIAKRILYFANTITSSSEGFSADNTLI